MSPKLRYSGSGPAAATAVSSLSKSENLAIGTSLGHRLSVLIYSVIVYGFKFYIIHGLKTSPKLACDTYITCIMSLINLV